MKPNFEISDHIFIIKGQFNIRTFNIFPWGCTLFLFLFGFIAPRCRPWFSVSLSRLHPFSHILSKFPRLRGKGDALTRITVVVKPLSFPQQTAISCYIRHITTYISTLCYIHVCMYVPVLLFLLSARASFEFVCLPSIFNKQTQMCEMQTD